MNKALDMIRDGVRAIMRTVARGLNALTGGKLSPNVVTIVGLLAHLPIAWLIATTRNNIWAAILLVVFGLFDTLDGELARLQKRASSSGMVLDAVTDRMKEVILYVGIIAAIIHRGQTSDIGLQYIAAAVVAACGGSLLVSYVKAKGETALASQNLTPNEKNRIFQDGFLRYEIRMFLLALGLVSDYLILSVFIIAVLSWLTAFQRLILIMRKLKDV
jgi:CDP-diacylglycerol---glycerol-3-phosphate 3-phosphatidyltransferase